MGSNWFETGAVVVCGVVAAIVDNDVFCFGRGGTGMEGFLGGGGGI